MSLFSIPPIQRNPVILSSVRAIDLVDHRITMIAIVAIAAVTAALSFLGWLTGPGKFTPFIGELRTPATPSPSNEALERPMLENSPQEDRRTTKMALRVGVNDMPDDGDCLLHSLCQTVWNLPEGSLRRYPGESLTHLRREIAVCLLDEINKPNPNEQALSLLDFSIADYNLQIDERISASNKTKDGALQKRRQILSNFLTHALNPNKNGSSFQPAPLLDENKVQNQLLETVDQEMHELQERKIKNEGSKKARIEYLNKMLENGFFLGFEAIYALHILYGVNIKVRSKDRPEQDNFDLGTSTLEGAPTVILLFSTRERGPHYDAYVPVPESLTDTTS